MSSQMRVNAEDLWASSAMVDSHAATLNQVHTASDYTIEGTLPGLPALAAAAMAERSADWHITTMGLISQLTGHAATYAESAAAYVTTDETNAERLRGVGSSLRFS